MQAPLAEHIDTVRNAFNEARHEPTVLHINGTRVLVCRHTDASTLVIRVAICDLPRHGSARAALCEALLMANTRLGGNDRLGIDPAERAAVIQRTVSNTLDAGALGNELCTVVDAADRLRQGLGWD
jgi:hypothetical protein